MSDKSPSDVSPFGSKMKVGQMSKEVGKMSKKVGQMSVGQKSFFQSRKYVKSDKSPSDVCHLGRKSIWFKNESRTNVQNVRRTYVRSPFLA